MKQKQKQKQKQTVIVNINTKQNKRGNNTKPFNKVLPLPIQNNNIIPSLIVERPNNSSQNINNELLKIVTQKQEQNINNELLRALNQQYEQNNALIKRFEPEQQRIQRQHPDTIPVFEPEHEPEQLKQIDMIPVVDSSLPTDNTQDPTYGFLTSGEFENNELIKKITAENEAKEKAAKEAAEKAAKEAEEKAEKEAAENEAKEKAEKEAKEKAAKEAKEKAAKEAKEKAAKEAKDKADLSNDDNAKPKPIPSFMKDFKPQAFSMGDLMKKSKEMSNTPAAKEAKEKAEKEAADKKEKEDILENKRIEITSSPEYMTKKENLNEIINDVTGEFDKLPKNKFSAVLWTDIIAYVDESIIPKLDPLIEKDKAIINDYEKNLKNKEYNQRFKSTLQRIYDDFIKNKEEKFKNEFPINNLKKNRYFITLQEQNLNR